MSSASSYLHDETSIAGLEAEVSTGAYCARNGRSLLRLYQRYPARARGPVIDALLLRALMALPEPDFVQALSLLPDAAATPAAPALAELEQLLQKAQFGEFWERAKDPTVAPLVAAQAGFVDAVRGFIAGVLRSAFRRVEPGVIARALGMDAGEATVYAKAQGWVVGEGGAVELPSTADNTPRPTKKLGEDGLGLQFDQVSAVLRG